MSVRRSVMLESTSGEMNVLDTVKPRPNGPGFNGILLITDASSLSLQPVHLYFFYWLILALIDLSVLFLIC